MLRGFVLGLGLAGLDWPHHPAPPDMDLTERLRCGLRAKQQGELCERVGELNLFTTLCQESTGKGVGRGMCAMLDAAGVVERDRTSWSGVGAPSMNIGWVVAAAGVVKMLFTSMSSAITSRSLIPAAVVGGVGQRSIGHAQGCVT